MAKGLTLQELQAMGAKPAQTGGFTLEQLQAQQKPANPLNGFEVAAQGVLSTFQKGGERIVSEAQKIQPATNLPSLGINTAQTLKTAGISALEVFKGAGSILASPFVTAYESLPEDIKKQVGDTAETAIQKTVEALPETAKINLSNLATKLQENPEYAPIVQDTADLLFNTIGLGAGRVGVDTLKTGGKEVAERLAQLTTKSEQQIESAILKKFEKGVKPLLPSKTTPSKLADYRDDVITAVKTIKQNQPNLSFVDEAGDSVVGESPKSLQQLSEAVEQTKKTVFNSYDALAKQAGKAGVVVNLKTIASELDPVIKSKALRISNPRAIQYAEDLQKRLISEGKLDATTAQDVIQNYNKSLEAFYRNPTYDNASTAAIDALLVNKMRAMLDEGISGLTGAEYQTLKNQYGALKAIEKDVIKATLRDARKDAKGLIDFTDIFSGGQVVSGILSLNPAQIASGLTQKAIAEYFKFLKNPNRAVEQMFKIADELP